MTRLNRPVLGPDGVLRQPGEDHDLSGLPGIEERYTKMGLVEGQDGDKPADPNNAEPSEDVKAWNEKSRKENLDAIQRNSRSGVGGTTSRSISGADAGAKMNAPADNKARTTDAAKATL